MSYKAHIFLDGDLRIKRGFDHIPQKGDTVRFDENTYGIVTEVVFILDEPEDPRQRVNIGVDSEPAPQTDRGEG